MSEPKEHLADWLRDAYAMEQKAVEILSRQIDRLDHYPELEARLRQHLEETIWQAEKVKECLERLGEDTSMIKTGIGKISGNLTAMGAMFSPDEIVKDSLANSIFEHMEVASYKILIAAAEHAGEMEIAEICREILRQEEAMADFMDSHIPDTTVMFLTRDSAGMEAKV